MRILVVATGLAIPLAFGSAQAAPAPLPPVRYTCEDGTRLRVTFSASGAGPGTALVRVLGTEKEFMVVQAPSADGGRYVAAKVEFWDKGSTATFTRDAVALVCPPKR